MVVEQQIERGLTELYANFNRRIGKSEEQIAFGSEEGAQVLKSQVEWSQGFGLNREIYTANCRHYLVSVGSFSKRYRVSDFVVKARDVQKINASRSEVWEENNWLPVERNEDILWLGLLRGELVVDTLNNAVVGIDTRLPVSEKVTLSPYVGIDDHTQVYYTAEVEKAAEAVAATTLRLDGEAQIVRLADELKISQRDLFHYLSEKCATPAIECPNDFCLIRESGFTPDGQLFVRVGVRVSLEEELQSFILLVNKSDDLLANDAINIYEEKPREIEQSPNFVNKLVGQIRNRFQEQQAAEVVLYEVEDFAAILVRETIKKGELSEMEVKGLLWKAAQAKWEAIKLMGQLDSVAIRGDVMPTSEIMKPEGIAPMWVQQLVKDGFMPRDMMCVLAFDGSVKWFVHRTLDVSDEERADWREVTTPQTFIYDATTVVQYEEILLRTDLCDDFNRLIKTPIPSIHIAPLELGLYEPEESDTPKLESGDI